jgi:hypothetical protein
LHIQNVYDEQELSREGTHKDFLTVRREGRRDVRRTLTDHNLDMVLSVGCRVKSKTATTFRIWATQRLREYIVKGFALDDERLKYPDLPFAPPALPEADESDMEYFITQAKIILPVLGINLFRSAATTTALPSHSTDRTPMAGESLVFQLQLKKEGIIAHAREIDGEFTVMEGSQVRTAWTGTHNPGYKALRDKLVQDGIITAGTDGLLRFTPDQVFTSPSAAVAVIVGHTKNGRTGWTIQSTGMSYGAWQSQDTEESLEDGTA